MSCGLFLLSHFDPVKAFPGKPRFADATAACQRSALCSVAPLILMCYVAPLWIASCNDEDDFLSDQKQ